MKKELIAPCGMNCGICIGFFGYTINGKKRKIKCVGCKPRDKSCAFLKKYCKKLAKKEIEYCYECIEFPCKHLQLLDKRYREKYDMSMIKNLEFIKENGIEKFLEEEYKKWKCPNCGGTICCHNGICFGCGFDKLKK